MIIQLLGLMAVFAAAPASAATFIVGAGSGGTPIARNNDFRQSLADHGLGTMRTNASLTISGPARVTYEYFASDSRFKNRFTSGGVSFIEYNKTRFGPSVMGVATFEDAESFSASFTSSGHRQTHRPGSDQVGFVLPAGVTGAYRTSTLWIAYDDEINNDDDNHDDFIIRATISGIPEPEIWATMIVGFGLAGLAARARRAGRPYSPELTAWHG